MAAYNYWNPVGFSSSHRHVLKLLTYKTELRFVGREVIERFYQACWHLLNCINPKENYKLRLIQCTTRRCNGNFFLEYNRFWSISIDGRYEIENTDDILRIHFRPQFELCWYKRRKYLSVNKRLKLSYKTFIELMLFVQDTFKLEQFKLY